MKISVITINYNNLSGLKETVNSVLSQSYDSTEYIIIDGGSTDGSAEYIQSVSSCLTYWISEKDKGVYNAMNKGIDQATGDFLIFMNSGDRFFNSSVLYEIFSDKYYEADVLVGSTIYSKGDTGIVRHPRNLAIMQKELPFCHQSAFIKGSLMRSKKYEESFKIIADYHFFFQIWREGKTFQNIKKIVSIYDTSGLSSLQENAKIAYNERCKIWGKQPNVFDFYFRRFKTQLKKIVISAIPSTLLDCLMKRPKGSNSATPIVNIMQL